MKKILKSLPLLGIVVLLAACGGPRSTVGVRVQPSHPVYARPMAPSRSHLWVSDEWVWRNNNYVYKPGYWAVPPKRSVIRYTPGYWNNSRNGYQWRPGHWQRGRR